MNILCNKEKLERIKIESFGKKLWDNRELKNPCIDSMLAYNAAYTASELSDLEKAEYYYKIASTQSGAPLASRFLGPLMQGKEGDHRTSAEKFLLIALDGYDEDPYVCQTLSVDLLKKIKNQNLAETVSRLRREEDSLPSLRDTKNPLASGNSTCHEAIIRAMKQIYLAHLTEVARTRSDLEDGDALIRAGLLDSIPSIRDQDGWTVVRDKNGLWQYRKPLKIDK
jgi:hypothetical protein